MEDYKVILELLSGKTMEDDDHDFLITSSNSSDKKMNDWNPNFCVYRGQAETFALLPNNMHVLVDVSVLEIPPNAFFQQDCLQSIAFPRDLLRIGDRAFFQCSSLVTLVLPPLLEMIGKSSFADCTSLTRIQSCSNNNDKHDEISISRLKCVHDGCFSGCRSLQQIQLPSLLLDYIGKRAFYNCSQLQQMDLSACNKLTRIENQAFGFCTSLTTCRLPGTLTTIGTSAFGQCYELHTVQIIKIGDKDSRLDNNSNASSLTIIQDQAFASCRSLKTIALPSSLQRVGKRAFANCLGLMTVELAPSVELQEVGEQAFLHCKRLVNIALPEPIAHSNCLRPNVFEGCTDLQERFAPIIQLMGNNNNHETFLKEALCIRYDASPLHKLCYQQAHMTVEESMNTLKTILANIAAKDEPCSNSLKWANQSRWMDIFQMTPIHILVASSKANPKLLQGILDHYARRLILETESTAQDYSFALLLSTKDLWGRIPLHLACLNDSIPIAMMVEILLRAHDAIQAWNLQPCHWESCVDAAMYHHRQLLSLLVKTRYHRQITALRSTAWRQEVLDRIATIETSSVPKCRSSLVSLKRLLQQYEQQESIALLRSAIWKLKLKGVNKENGTVSEEERAHCLIQSCDEVVTANILPFLNWSSTTKVPDTIGLDTVSNWGEQQTGTDA